MSGDFGEHLARLAGEGRDISAPVPYARRGARERSITGDDWKRSLFAARKRRAGTDERMAQQIEAAKAPPPKDGP